VAVRAIRWQEARRHGQIADSVAAAHLTRWYLRRSERIWRCRQERTVKPSAQPTLVRTQHLPPPAETASWLRKRARGAVFVLVTSRIRVCHCASRRRGVHGRIADGVRAGRAVGDTAGFPRTATDGPGKRGLVPAQVRCRCHAPPDGRHRPGRAGAAAAEGRAVRQTVASAARGASGQLLHWRGCPSRTALTERDSPRPTRRSRSEQNDAPMSRQGIRVAFSWSHLRVLTRMADGAVCWVADKTGMVHSGEGKLL
jgi:hypothetical protein